MNSDTTFVEICKRFYVDLVELYSAGTQVVVGGKNNFEGNNDFICYYVLSGRMVHFKIRLPDGYDQIEEYVNAPEFQWLFKDTEFYFEDVRQIWIEIKHPLEFAEFLVSTTYLWASDKITEDELVMRLEEGLRVHSKQESS